MVTLSRRGSSRGERPLLWCSIPSLFIVLFITFVSLLLYAVQLRSSLAAQYSFSSYANPTIPKNKSISPNISIGGNRQPVQVAYAISLVKCSDFQSSTSGLVDSATVLRHSVHQTSVRNPNSGSKYDYKMYAIVHKKAESCSHMLEDLGYNVIIEDSPVSVSEIRGDYLREKIHREWCCGADEFVKLYAYTIFNHPIVVHSDIDFMYVKPMDDLFDSMLLPHDSNEGKAARKKVELEYPDKRENMPENIHAFLTRDYHQVIPGRKAAFQGGFIVLKPNQKVFDEYLEIIREGNYVEGFSRENGWGGKGYGAVVGAMAVQGLVAYYYDEVAPNTSVELNGCRYNHMGANIFYEDVPNFIRKYKSLHGKCRRNVEGCEDCRKTALDLIKNIHFTNCRKPWNCAGCEGEGCTGKGNIDPRTSDYNHCMQVARTWHEMRNDLEQQIAAITGNDNVLVEGKKGKYKKEFFMGHCNSDGQSGYVPIAASKENMAVTLTQIWKDAK